MNNNTNSQNRNNAEFDIEILEQRYKDTYVVDPLFSSSKEGVDVNNWDVYLDFLIEAVGTPEEKKTRKKSVGKRV